MSRLLRFTSLPVILLLLSSCENNPDIPKLVLTTYEGSRIELNDETPLTAVFFFSISNPVAVGAFYRLTDELHEAADSVGIAMHVDRPPNVAYIQQRTLVPIVIDEGNRISEAFGGVDLTPTIFLIEEGKILFHQRGRVEIAEVNATIHERQ